jgi:N-sulfoglucosamine sulfohydrolase
MRALLILAALLWLSPSAARVDAADAPRPNILFCIADDVSYPHMGAYGCSWVQTPGFDRVAREGLLFHNAYTPNAKCAPSRSCIVTGRNSWQLEEAANHWCFFPAKFKSFSEALAEHGYFVGCTAKGWGPGIAKDAAGNDRQLTGRPFNDRKLTPPAKNIVNTDYAANFDDFLAANTDGQPWCFWYGALEPHRAYEFGAGLTKGGKQLADVDRVPAFWPDNDVVRTDLLDYAFEIEWFDSHLAKMLDRLERSGQLDNTLVVVTADNGMPFPRVKGQEYEMSNHLPLAIRWPRGIKAPGRAIDDYVSFIDFAPTFIEVAGLAWADTGMAPSPGRSLTDLFGSEQAGRVNPQRDHVLIGKERHDVGRPNDEGYPIRGIVRDGTLYLRNFEPSRWPACNPETGYLNCDGSPTKTEVLATRTNPELRKYWEWSFGKKPAEELYDVKADPDCLHNLAADPARAALREALQAQLFDELRQQEDPRMFGRGEMFEKFLYTDPAVRDFYNRYMKGEKLKPGWVNPTDFEVGPVDVSPR